MNLRSKARTLSLLRVVKELAQEQRRYGRVGSGYLPFLATLAENIDEDGRPMRDLTPADVDSIRQVLRPCWKNDPPPPEMDDLLEAAGRLYDELYGLPDDGDDGV